MHCIRANLSFIVLVVVMAGHAQARCLDFENAGIPESTPTADFSIHPDGTLSAPATGLMWKRCLEGQALNGGVCEGTPSIYSWADALVAADAIVFAGYSDWRLPNPKELLTIFEDKCAGPALNADLFPITEVFGAWTATPTAILRLDLYDEVWFFSSDSQLRRTSEFASLSILLVRDLP